MHVFLQGHQKLFAPIFLVPTDPLTHFSDPILKTIVTMNFDQIWIWYFHFIIFAKKKPRL